MPVFIACFTDINYMLEESLLEIHERERDFFDKFQADYWWIKVEFNLDGGEFFDNNL